MSQRQAFSAPRIFDGDIWHDNAAVVVNDGKIKELVPINTIGDMPVNRVEDGFLAPGFVDLQVNGGGGVLLNNDPSVEGIRAICAAHARYGTTALLPTLITDTDELRDQAIAAGLKAAELNVPGFAGLHLEGPNLSVARKGAHDPNLIHPLTDNDIDTLVAARKALPALLTTIAAESANPEQVRALAAAGIKVSLGHSNATSAEAFDLIAAGATMVTHLFNAMSPFTGREPGMVGAALSSGDVHAGLIADGYHVHPQSIALALRAKIGPGRIFLVTDAMSTVGTDVAELVLNGRHIERKDGKLTLPDGTLAGADLDMATAVRTMRDKVAVNLEEALKMASLYPANALGVPRLGRLQPGSAANMVWLNDALEARQTWISGNPLSD